MGRIRKCRRCMIDVTVQDRGWGSVLLRVLAYGRARTMEIGRRVRELQKVTC